jgi:uncharacterized cofD-like protein
MKHTATEPQALLAATEQLPGPHVVAVGGGHGLAQALAAARHYAGRIDAVVTVADDGGSSGRLAPALDIPPPGDIRKCLVALTPEDTAWRRLFEHRFEGSDVAGHSLGNLIIAALSEIEGSFRSAVRCSEQLLGAVGSVIPAADAHLRLEAVIDGSPVFGQETITRTRGVISEVRVVPEDVAAEVDALRAISEADQIVLGPGSLYTSVIATLKVPGIVDAINESGAQLVYVANLITQDGETLGMDGADHLDALIRLTGLRPPAAIVANDAVVIAEPPLEAVAVDAEVIATYGTDLVATDLIDRGATWPQHDPAKLGGALGRLFRG